MMIPSIAVLQMVMQTASSTASTTSRRLAFLPERHTDFIFSVRRDEFSIIGLAILVLVLFTITRVLKRRRARQGSSKTE